MRALLVGDVHLSDKPPSVRTDSYADDILDKLAHIVGLANTPGWEIDVVIQAGDLFHIKTPSRTSHQLVQSTIEVLTQCTKPILIVPGNHDMQHDRLDSLASQPLGVVAKAPGIDLLVGPHPTLPVYGIPFLQDWNDLHGEMKAYRQWSGQYAMNPDDGNYPLLVTHAPIMPPGQSAPYDFINADDWSTLMENGACYYGHIHEAHGYYSAGPGGLPFCNMGALSRGSLHETDLRRTPHITVYDSTHVPATADPWQVHPVPCKPVSECYKMADVDKIESSTVRLDSFLRKVGSTTLETASIEGVIAHIRTLSLNQRTEAEAVRLLEEASHT
jgi:hypothetical protein